jgi:hypothetical protein
MPHNFSCSPEYWIPLLNSEVYVLYCGVNCGRMQGAYSSGVVCMCVTSASETTNRRCTKGNWLQTFLSWSDSLG